MNSADEPITKISMNKGHIPLHVAFRAFPIRTLMLAIFPRRPRVPETFFQEISSVCPDHREG